MVTQSRSEARNLVSGSFWASLLPYPLVRSALAFCCFEAAYYFAYRYGMSFGQASASPFWFPDSVLLCALLRVRPRWWWLLLAGTLPIRFLSEAASAVPFGMLLGTTLNDWVKGMVGAALLKRFITDPTRFASLRDIGVYCLIAVLAVPAASAFAGAASRGGSGDAYWASWEQWFLGNATTHLIVTPFIFYWLLRPVIRRNLSAMEWLEVLLIASGLVISLAFAFEPATNQLGFADARVYAPVVFLGWAAVLYGMRGATAAMAILTCFAVAAAQSGEGAFGNSPAESASGLQQFLLLRAVPLYLVAVLLEQTRRVQLSLNESERRFRDIADNAPVMIWIVGPDAMCEFTSKGWLEFKGRTLSQELGDGWADGMHPDDQQRCMSIYRESVAARREFEMDYRMRRRDGEYRWVLDRGVPRYSPSGEFIGFIGSAIDVTDRRQQDAAMRLSEERYRAVVESQTELVCRFTPDLTLTFVNEAYCRLHGKRRDALLGTRLLGHLPRETRELVATCVSHALTAKEPVEWECEATFPDGSAGWQHWSCRSIAITGDSPPELQAIGHDITDRKRAEQAQRQLAHAARLAAVGELTAMIAHEINQPLCAILSNAEAAETLLRRENPPLDEIREIIADIRDDDLRADEVIRGIRSLSGRRETKFQSVDLNRMVAHVLRLVSGDAVYRRVRIQRDFDTSLPLVWADQPQIEQVLLNLIVNGMDAMQATPDAARDLNIQTRGAGAGFVEVSVSDNGCGIPPERLAELFDSFFTTKPEGMGVGLSIARSIVLAHGGRVWAANREGCGAVFRFTLRTAEAAAELTTDSGK